MPFSPRGTCRAQVTGRLSAVQVVSLGFLHHAVSVPSRVPQWALCRRSARSLQCRSGGEAATGEGGAPTHP